MYEIISNNEKMIYSQNKAIDVLINKHLLNNQIILNEQEEQITILNENHLNKI